MARLTPAPAEQYEPLFGAGASLPNRIYAQRPELAEPLVRAVRTILTGDNLLSPRLVELVRLRIAFHNQCRSCMALRYSSGTDAGVDEDLVCSLERPPEAEDLTTAERAALAYADLMANNHLAITDDTYDGLRLHFTEPEIVELGMVCGVCVGLGRLMASWDMVDGLPARFQERGIIVTPWGDGAVIRA
jgi:AhpD family alkylhydroperoxidase